MNDKPKPKRKTQVLKVGQVEEHEIGLTFSEEECPLCDGSGELIDEWEGNEYPDVCGDCDGSGILYISINTNDE